MKLSLLRKISFSSKVHFLSPSKCNKSNLYFLLVFSIQRIFPLDEGVEALQVEVSELKNAISKEVSELRKSMGDILLSNVSTSYNELPVIQAR